MITTKDLEVLYYKTPRKYRMKLDGDYDPEYYENIKKHLDLEEMLNTCSIPIFISTYIQIFKDKYPNVSFLYMMCVDWWDENENVNPAIRAGIQNISFEYSEGVNTDFDVPTEYLKELSIVLDKEIHPSLTSLVETNLRGKSFEKVSEGVYDIKDSPLTRIVATANTLHFYIDKNSFIDYKHY